MRCCRVDSNLMSQKKLVPRRRPFQTRIERREAELSQPPTIAAVWQRHHLRARKRGGGPPTDEVPVELGELVWDPAPAAEVGRGAQAHAVGTLAARASAPAPASGARSAAPAFRGLVRRAARLAEEVEDVEVFAAMAAAWAGRVQSRQFAGQSRDHSPTMGGDGAFAR